MNASVYLHPIGLSAGPQAESTGDGPAAIRLAGSMAYASRFALVVRDGEAVTHRRIFSVADAASALAEAGGALSDEAERQWANLQLVHAPIQLGDRTIRLDQPQIMGVLNVTPDSFSDGGEFLEKPDAAPGARGPARRPGRRASPPGAPADPGARARGRAGRAPATRPSARATRAPPTPARPSRRADRATPGRTRAPGCGAPAPRARRRRAAPRPRAGRAPRGAVRAPPAPSPPRATRRGSGRTPRPPPARSRCAARRATAA